MDVLRQSIASLEGKLLYKRFGTIIASVRARDWVVDCLRELGEFAEGARLRRRSSPDSRRWC